MTTITRATEVAWIRRIDRERNSRNGNPRFRITYEDTYGMTCIATTAADAAIGYEVGNPGLRENDHVILTLDGRTRIIDVQASDTAPAR